MQSKVTKELFQKAAGTYNLAKVKLFDAEVVSVNEQDRTCIVNSLDGSLDNFSVRCMLEVSDGDFNLPTVGSNVTVAMTDFTDPYVVLCTWLDKKNIIVGDTQIQMVNGNVTISQGKFIVTLSNGKINIKNDSQDFKTVMDSFFEHIFAMTFTNGAGTTSPPNNLSDFENDKSNFDEIFN